LLRELERQRWIRQAGMQVVVLRTAQELRAALAAPRKWFAIVNLISEGFPAESAAQCTSLLREVSAYVRNGGIWWEAGGGYSFHHAVVPAADMRFTSANRHFCDFAAINSKSGRWSFFGIQSPSAIYVPPAAEISASGPGDARSGRYSHTFMSHAAPQQDVQLPWQKMVFGTPHRQALRQYAQRNKFTQGLADKAPAEVVERLKQAILLKVTTRDLQQSAKLAAELPCPVVFHIADYLRGGFDKQYPDHLPPNPDVGTPEDLTRLIEVCRERGHLFMPYTNPTWWCVNPKGPTFERVGEAPLARDLDGNVYPESYGAPTTQGYATCPWHPAVRQANNLIREQFTRQFPVDVLFQDQVGARGSVWDTNPASPHPGAYLEGIHRIAQQDAPHVPLGTEDGHDRLINSETMFCGLSWPWLPNRPSRAHVLFEDIWPDESWRFEPLALFLAHGKVLFYHHDLGGFVRNRRDLSITLAMGYGLSWWTHSPVPSRQERDWIERLVRLQEAIGPRCAGRALDEFEYLAPQVIRSCWGDLEIVANLSASPWLVDEGTVVAPEGFVARAADLEAGILTRHPRLECSAHGTWIVRRKDVTGWSQWMADPPAGDRNGRLN
jgi:hypothetical protein